jgi:hypothetical protein
LHWKLHAEKETELKFRVGVNWKSWGEIVSVDFQRNKILINSKCWFPLQCLDWGKNKDNCRKFSEAYET